MILEPKCGYFNEERNDEYAPPYGECEECYRYDICKKAKIQELRTGIEDGWIKSDKETIIKALKACSEFLCDE